MTARPKQPALFDLGPEPVKPKRVRRKVPLYRDCPPCAECGLPLATPVNDGCREFLCCPSCGCGWIEADAAKVEQAWRAQEAWERFCDRKARV